MNIDLITKYLAQETNVKEKNDLEIWIHDSNENRKVFDQIAQIWYDIELAKVYRSEYILNVLLKINDKIEAKTNTSKTIRLNFFKKIAVVLFIISAFTISYFVILNTNKQYNTNRKKIEIHLPDQTVVVLNKHSTLHYSSGIFKNRHVELTGEAYFKVQFNENKPFIITSGKTEISVLGTSFYVSAYKSHEKTDIKVTSGFVQVTGLIQSTGKNNLILKSGECAEVNYLNNSLNKYSEYDENALAWNTGKLVFKATKLKEVFKTLESNFDISIETKNPDIADYRFTGIFHDTPIKDIIETLSKTFELQVNNDIEHGIITFY